MMNVSVMKKNASESKSEIQEWIDEEVPHIIDEEAENLDPEYALDEEQLKQIEKKITEMLKEYFK